MEWISVKDRLPDNADSVIACMKDNKTGDVYVGEAYYSIYSKEWMLGDIQASFYNYTITHWMPMPKLPEE